MNDFVSPLDRPLLDKAGLLAFDVLWNLALTPVDQPNVDRGGWSSVCRLDLPEQGYYLKRQTNHLTRSLAHPFGEPTLAREFRHIRRYAERDVPAMTAAFFGTRRDAEGYHAILLTRALSGWRDLGAWLEDWENLPAGTRQGLVAACGDLARRLHDAGLIHGCFYPRHTFVQEKDGRFTACLIDLEKTRRLWFPRRDRVKDLEQFIRHAPQFSAAEIDMLLGAYLQASPQGAQVARWKKWLQARKIRKEGET
ncbi:MAG: lipopolysaccharide kinase InaA family protein [Zoogloeaceae bacterium]|jgi:hypothetical protein|nr:lipopolysaccharide kinase InaA family protein [Zoogloeaceae bacterium]